MRWSVALRAGCVAAAVMVCGAGAASAQDAEAEVSDSEAIAPAPSEEKTWYENLILMLLPIDELPSLETSPSRESMGALGISLPDIAPPLSFDMLSGGTRPDPILLYAGFDIWRFGLAGYGGMQWAPGRQNNDGFILRLFGSGGLERFTAGTKTYSTQIFRAAVLPGWQFKRGSFVLQLFAGPDAEIHVLTPDIPATRLRGLNFGARVAADLWWEPTSRTMLASSISATTIGKSYSARGAAGWRFFERFWAGPEISTSRDEFSTQHRFGAHLTGFRTAGLEWSAAAGYLTDSFGRHGAYGRIGAAVRQ